MTSKLNHPTASVDEAASPDDNLFPFLAYALPNEGRLPLLEVFRAGFRAGEYFRIPAIAKSAEHLAAMLAEQLPGKAVFSILAYDDLVAHLDALEAFGDARQAFLVYALEHPVKEDALPSMEELRSRLTCYMAMSATAAAAMAAVQHKVPAELVVGAVAGTRLSSDLEFLNRFIRQEAGVAQPT